MFPTLHLPTYVYVLFCAFVYIGVKRCFARQVTPLLPLLSPIGFAMLGATSLHARFPRAGVGADAAALASLAAGAALAGSMRAAGGCGSASNTRASPCACPATPACS